MPFFRLARVILLTITPLFLVMLLTVASAARAQATDSSADDPANAYNVGLREHQWIGSIQSNLVSEKFDDLDNMANRYRREKSRLPGGEWRLRLFYSALDAPHQTDQDTRDHLAHLEHWMRQRPDSITPRVAFATSLIRWAWVARGNGLPKTVTPEGWRLFNERTKKAQAFLEDSANMSVMCPRWYSVMMAVGLAQS